jgi:hypothetical protein
MVVVLVLVLGELLAMMPLTDMTWRGPMRIDFGAERGRHCGGGGGEGQGGVDE